MLNDNILEKSLHSSNLNKKNSYLILDIKKNLGIKYGKRLT